MAKIEILNNPATTLVLSTSLVYGVAYAGRTYFSINPLHAALFSLGTFITSRLGKELAKKIGNDLYIFSTFPRRTLFFISQYMPAALALTSGVFSPLQVIIALGLINLCTSSYFTLTGNSPYY